MYVRLGEICDFQSGGTPSKNNQKFFDGDIPWITTVALKGLGIDGSDAVNWITEEAIKQSAAKIVPANSIMIGTRVGVGKVAINLVDMSTSQDIVSLIGIDETRWCKEYLCKCLIGKSQYLNSQARGATIKGIKIDTLANLKIPEISIEKQYEVSRIIDKTRIIIEQRKQELMNLNELMKARFVELFGDPDNNEKKWDIDKMEHLCEVGSSKRIYQNEQSMKGVPFLRISDLVNRIDTGSKDCDLYIPIERFTELKEQGLVPRSGDILLTARGTLGRCYIVQSDDEFYFQDGMITWLSNYDKRITALYISYLFEMPGFRKQIDALQAGSTVAYMSIAMTKKLDVMVPPIELQNQFSDFVRATDKSKVAVQKALDETQLLFDSLMQEYFG